MSRRMNSTKLNIEERKSRKGRTTLNGSIGNRSGKDSNGEGYVSVCCFEWEGGKRERGIFKGKRERERKREKEKERERKRKKEKEKETKRDLIQVSFVSVSKR